MSLTFPSFCYVFRPLLHNVSFPSLVTSAVETSHELLALTHEQYCCVCKFYYVSDVHHVISFLHLPQQILNENVSENSVVP
jgi:hypothetical protein